MKKIKYLGVLLFVGLFMTGCGKSTDEVEKALENMQNLKSSTIEIITEVGTAEYSITTTTKTDIVKDGTIAHSTAKMNIYGNLIESESYTEKVRDTLYTYTTEDGGQTWTYTTEDGGTSSNGMDSVNQLTENYKTIKKVKSDRKGENKYELTIDKSVLNDAIEAGDEGTFQLEEDLTLAIYIKDNYITTMELDLLGLTPNIQEEGITVYKMTFNISNHNQIDEITIPAEVKKNATLSEEE